MHLIVDPSISIIQRL